ncbi:MAG: lytic transglycosylase domain-containing protein [Fimbriimonas sp.]|nr:lytic transglycosylase domain-containing protein [Fimbriimonas sp.]
MKRFLTAASILLSLAGLGYGQTLKDYLRVRKTNGIVESVGVAALETLFGTRTFEIQGVVKGSFSVDHHTSLLLEKTDGDTMMVDATTIPDWLVGTEAPCRLIVKATRTEVDGPLKATMIAAAREEEVQPVEADLVAAAARAAMAKHRASTSASRHKGNVRYTPNMKAPSRIWTLPADEATPYYAAFILKDNPRLSPREATRIAQGVLGFSRRYGVDARLIVAMIVCESDFNPNEVSRAGAMGLGQLMPDTVNDYGINNPFDTIDNLYGTVREIRSHMDKYRNETGDDYQALVLGLAAYNAGEGAVKRHGGVPPYRETQNYVRKVISLYYRLCGYK